MGLLPFRFLLKTRYAGLTNHFSIQRHPVTAPAREFLAEVHRVRASGGGTGERSFYGAFQNLVNAVGRSLKPKVFCVNELADLGAGRPDFGFYSADRLPRDIAGGDPLATPPDRGVVEMKAPGDDLWSTLRGPQLEAYWYRYGLILVTNLRGFVLVGKDQFGRRIDVEEFLLAESAEAFWALAAAPRRLSDEKARRLDEFLGRVLMTAASLTQPRDVAWFLASYARDSLARLEDEMAAPPDSLHRLGQLRETLESALGITFDGPKGVHLFRSTLVQTLFYGLFAAWVLWCRRTPDPEERKGFEAYSAVWHLRLPVLRQLYEEIYTPSALGGLGIEKTVDWAAAMLRRVDDQAFFERFREDRAVQYFYEPFLEAFDPQLRKQLGVWYTPPEVVDYMVERVDRALRSELGIADGLADDRVHVLDPCCGTGSYVVAVLRRIEKTLRQKSDDALVGADVKKAAIGRVHGFEIMPAPFVIAHMQVGLLLDELNAPLAEQGQHTSQRAEFVSIKLTNALTDWDETYDRPGYLPIPAIQDERDEAREIKRREEILVVLGNPPYNGYAGMADHPEERALTALYRQVRRVRAPEGQGLNDLYVRFFRIADRKIAEQSGRGIVCFITNYSWLDGLSYTGMRERFLDVFDRIWIDSLNGDKYRTGKTTPDGRPDPSIFSVPANREGIQVGTAIGLLVRRGERPAGSPPAEVRYRDFWGTDKRQQLMAALEGEAEGEEYATASPHPSIGNPFVAGAAEEGYFAYPLLSELFDRAYPGVKTSRDEFLVDIDVRSLEIRIKEYFDQSIEYASIAAGYPSVTKQTARYDPQETRMRLLRSETARVEIVRYCYRPFDYRWLAWVSEGKLLDEKRPDFFDAVRSSNLFIEARERDSKDDFDRGYVTQALADNFGSGLSTFFPLWARNREDLLGRSDDEEDAPAVPPRAQAFLHGLGVEPASLFHHCVAVLNTATYRTDNRLALRLDWPRIPLPASAERLAGSAALGRRVAALLDPETPAEGVEVDPHPAVRGLGVVATVGGAAPDLAVAARWGYAGQNGVTMPGRGDARPRPWTDDERAALAAGAAALGLGEAEALHLLGETVLDVHLNDTTYWRCVPERVWRFTIGGYQVVKKWLSYREQELLGRPLTAEEARYVGHVIRRLALLRLMAPALDANYRAVTANVWPWPRPDAP